MAFLKRAILAGWLVLLAAAAFAGSHPVWWDKAQRDAQEQGYKVLDAKGLKKWMDRGDKFLLIDVRPDYEFAAGHIPGARNLEFHLGDRSRLRPAKEASLKGILGPDKLRRVVIYCRSFK